MNEQKKRILLNVARNAIKDYLETHKKILPQKNQYNDTEFWEERATFVTLTIDNMLRGCIGSILPTKPLIIDIIDNAINSAFRDPRFYPLSQEELEFVEIEISILSIPKELTYSNYRELFSKIRPGIDGVIIKKGFYQATFLPQVWKEIPDKSEFFEHLCLKAGLSIDCYKENSLKVETYQVESFKESDFKNK